MMQNLDSRMNEAAEKSRPLSCGRRAAAVVSAGLAFALALSGALPATSALALEDEEDEGYYLEEQSYFSSRTTAPSASNPWFYSGANPYFNYPSLAPTGTPIEDGKYVIGNCTWYAWGRAAELLGHAPAIGSGGPDDMVAVAQANGIPTGPVPAVGALAVGTSWTGSRHVAVVEDTSGSVPYVSQSGYTIADEWPGAEGVVFNYIPLGYAFEGEVTYVYLSGGGMTYEEVAAAEAAQARAEREAYADELAETLSEDGSMYRLYNPNSGEHFYTGHVAEACALVVEGWEYEGLGWVAPMVSLTPVYRLYNPYAGDHHYTTSSVERDYLIEVGWNDEGIGWYSDDTRSVPVYRQYNPYAEAGTHNYTVSAYERNCLVDIGWRDEGIGWYAIG